MSKYVDGYVLCVPKKKLATYKKIASKAAEIWREYGALDYRECVGDDMKVPEGMLGFPKLAKPKTGEVVVFSYIVFKSRKQRDSVNKKVMSDKRLHEMCSPDDMPFDCKRMAWGGFTTLVGD
jgi:uncharacterized protein YbaA (DUF1428 family)